MQQPKKKKKKTVKTDKRCKWMQNQMGSTLWYNQFKENCALIWGKKCQIWEGSWVEINL